MGLKIFKKMDETKMYRIQMNSHNLWEKKEFAPKRN